MKITITYVALLGLSCAQLSDRAPQGPLYKETPPGKQITDQTGGPKAPIKNMIGSVPGYISESKKNSINKDGGNLKGNIKKPNNSWTNNRLCRKDSGACSYKSRHVRLTAGGQARVAGVIGLQILAPYAREALEEVKKWPVVGDILAGINSALTALQEKIGGKQVPEIYGNELKLAPICWIRGEQRWPNDVDKACDRQREKTERKKTQGWAEQKWLDGLDRLLDVCSKLETKYPEDEQLRSALETRCATPEEEAEAIEKCRCFLSEFLKEDDPCYKTCRDGLVLQYPKCEVLQTNPYHREEYQLDPAKQLCPADLCDSIKKYPKFDDKERQNLLELNCAQPTTTSTSTSLFASPEPETVLEKNQKKPLDSSEKVEQIPKFTVEDLKELEKTNKQKDQLGRYGDVITELKNETSHAYTCYDNYRSNIDKVIASQHSIGDCDKQYNKVQALVRKAREISKEPDFPSSWLLELQLPDIQDSRTSLRGDATTELEDILQGLWKVAEKASVLEKQVGAAAIR
ncbi:hypothetical protein E5D57_013472 [Metarhizium anisopliae]|nr:hypothetical protein E5D57_013472 [Metarhizium anisopliae]